MNDLNIKNRNVLISGASLAGPSLAYWLSRYGFKPTIVEKAPALREGGYAVDIRGVAREVSERMGIMPAVRKATTGTRGMSFVNKANKSQAIMDLDFYGSEGPISDLEIMRGDLVHILYEVGKDNTEYIFNDSITSLTQCDEGVQVTFERSQPRMFDLVVGADGLHSNVRKLVFGDEAQFMHHLGYYAAIFTTPNHINLDRRFVVYNMPGKLVGMYPARQGQEAKAGFYFTIPSTPHAHQTPEQQKILLREIYAGEGWEIPRLLEAAKNAPDFYFDTMSLVEMNQWSQGRVVLLGDACYCPSPLSGQGTNLAMVGAYVLAGELKAAGGDYSKAFANYEKEMRTYVNFHQKMALTMGKQFIIPSQFKIWFRNLNLRLLPYLPWKGLILKVLKQQFEAISLKDY